MPSRRAVLRTTAAGLAALAGCTQTRDTPDTRTGTTSEEPTTGTTTPPSARPVGETATVDGLSVTPTGATTQHSLLYLAYPDAYGLFAPDSAFVFVDVSVDAGDGAAPVPGEFLLVGEDGQSFAGWVDYGDVRGPELAPDGGRRGGVYDPDAPDPDGWVGFSVPSRWRVDAPELRLGARTGGEDARAAWNLSGDFVAALSAPAPDFSVTDVTVPDRTPGDEPFTVSATVDNAGGPGTARAALNYSGPVAGAETVRTPVEAGATRTLEHEVGVHVGLRGVDSLGVDLLTPDGSFERTVEFTSPGPSG
jgi:hypothetical protein